LSEILRRVKQGRSVTISERWRDIARVVPIENEPDFVARLESLEHDGVIVRGSRDPAALRPLARRREAQRRFLRSRS
jgi:prevent-host-death family protein